MAHTNNDEQAQPAESAATPAFPVTASQFDSNVEQAEYFRQVMQEHKHIDAPWSLVTHAVIQMVKAFLTSSITATETTSNDADQTVLTILDLASGTGEPSLSIAKTVAPMKNHNHVKIYSTDLSPQSVEAASKAAQAAEISTDLLSTQVVDMTDLSSHFAADSIDIITCCSGLMFPSDKEKVMSEIYRVLKPDRRGTLVATTWDIVCGYALLLDIVQELHAEGFSSIRPILDPLSLAEPGLIEQLLVQAGFHQIQVTTSSYPINFGSNAEFQFKLTTMLIKDQLTELNAWEAAHTAFDKHVDKFAAPNEQGDRIFNPNIFKLIIATKG